MKKIIYIICGIFTLGLVLIIENINFIYAENDIENLLTIENNELNLEENINNLMDEYENEEIVKNEETSITNKLIDENNTDGLPKNEKIQTFEINQVYQEIDTSDYGIIRIKDPNNTGKGITIHDRNLGATATGAGVDAPIESFGYYYQWGNNYGFPTTGDIEKTDTVPVDTSSYGPKTTNGYYSNDTFIRGSKDWSNIHNDNLRGGKLDDENNERGLKSYDSVSGRRGPCPIGYHIPSIGERNYLLNLRGLEHTGSLLLLQGSYGLYYFEDNSHTSNTFYKRFNFPQAGGLNHNMNSVNGLYLWSSSPINSNAAFRLYGNSNSLYLYANNYRAYAFPIRCFYDSYRLPVIITYDINGGYWSGDNDLRQITIKYTSENSEIYSPDIELLSPKTEINCGKIGDKKCIFGGWYTLTGDELWTGNISEDITLYAKWIPYEEKDISHSGVNFTIMDRNLGAINPGIDENSYGYYLTGLEEDIICPEGYHIPSIGEWLGIKNLLSGDFNSDLVKDLLNLPFAGKVINNEVIETGENGYYLAKDGNEIMYAKINDSDIEIKNLNEGEKVSARCFKDYNTGTINFYTNGGDSIGDITAVNRREEGNDLPIPHKSNSSFLGWYNSNEEKIENNINYKNVEQIELFAKWECNGGYQEKGNKCEKIEKKSGGSSGGGGSSKNSEKSAEYQTGSSVDSSTSSQNDSKSSSGAITYPTKLDKKPVSVTPMDSSTSSQNDDITYPQEFIDAYNFAYNNGITSKPSIEDAKMYSSLTRIQMAKMLSNYAINVLGKQPDFSKGMINFSDVNDKLNKDYDNSVTLAYQLGIMGQNIKNNKFRPYDEVTRAEFTTALSRLLYGIEDGKGKFKYYEPHIIKLYNEGIINITNPKIKEKRGYVIIILMRSFN